MSDKMIAVTDSLQDVTKLVRLVKGEVELDLRDSAMLLYLVERAVAKHFVDARYGEVLVRLEARISGIEMRINDIAAAREESPKPRRRPRRKSAPLHVQVSTEDAWLQFLSGPRTRAVVEQALRDSATLQKAVESAAAKINVVVGNVIRVLDARYGEDGAHDARLAALEAHLAALEAKDTNP